MDYKEIINNFKSELENRINMYKSLIELLSKKDGMATRITTNKLLLLEAESILGILENLEKNKKGGN